MSQPRYQIFVSSTFQDLQDEREAVLNAILKLNQFPAGMEIFPAANDTPWEMIEKIIKDSDYYVLIVGGKYGSIDETGISFTEKEYDFAISQNVPVLAFIRSDEENIPAGKIEMDSEIREKLEKFKRKVRNNHHLNSWKSVEKLKENVLSSLSMAFVMNPRTGWVKAGGIEKSDLLERYAALQQKFDHSQKEIQTLKQSLLSSGNSKSLSQGDDIIAIEIKNYPKNDETIEVSWNELFLMIGQSLTESSKISDYEMKNIIKNRLLAGAIAKKESEGSYVFGYYSNARFDDRIIDQIGNQFVALDLIKISFDRMNNHFWAFTEKGRKYFAYQNAIYTYDD